MIKNRELAAFRRVTKDLVVTDKVFDTMVSIIHSSLVQRSDIQLHKLNGVVPQGPARDLCLVKPIGTKVEVLMNHATWERISAHKWQKEEIHLAAHIVDCLWVGTSTIFPKIVEGDWELQSSFLLALSWVLEDRWVAEVKYHLCSWFCSFAGQDEPESIDSIHRPGTLLLGPLARRVRQLVQKGDTKSWIFLNTLVNGFKKGLPRVLPSTVLKSAIKHKERLSRIGVTPEPILDKVRQAGVEIFRPDLNKDEFSWDLEKTSEFNEGVVLEDPHIRTVPSYHACTEGGRKSLGSLGALIREQEVCHVDSLWKRRKAERGYSFDFLFDLALTPTQLISICYHPRRAPWTLLYGDKDEDVIFEDEWRVCTGYEIRARFDYSDLMKSQRWASRFNGTVFKQDLALVKFILEPLKVRPITSMGFEHNSMFPEIQIGMWSALQRFRQFSLTGRVVGESDIRWLIDQTRETIPGLFRDEASVSSLIFNSGDFSGATDSCHMDLSTTLIDTVSKDPFIRRLLRFNLSEQEVSYSESGLEDFPDSFKMTNGQLMGSRFSFPLLCVFNLAIYWKCLEELGIHLALKDLPVFVNGDDILFLGPQVLLDLWSKRITEAGLEKSVGKNYESRSFCTINSQLFTVNLMEGDNYGLKTVPYINMGLVYGVKKQPFGGKDCMFHEKQKNRFKQLLGSFSTVRDLPGYCRESLEHQIRGHRPDIGKSFLPKSMLGFSPEHSVPDRTDLASREEFLKELCWSEGVDAEFKMGLERILQTHLVAYGVDETERDVGRARRQVYKRFEDFTLARMHLWTVRRKFWSQYGQDCDQRQERALRGLPEVKGKINKDSPDLGVVWRGRPRQQDSDEETEEGYWSEKDPYDCVQLCKYNHSWRRTMVYQSAERKLRARWLLS
jgi:hypothetical protein